MPATVINGIFQSTQVIWATPSVGQASTGIVCVANVGNSSITLTGASVSGTFASDYSIPGGQFPVTVNPGQTALIQVTYTSSANAEHDATLSVTGWPFTMPLVGGPFSGAAGQLFPSGQFTFPGTRVGATTSFAFFRIVNTFNGLITISNVSLNTGTNFSLTGVPATPFTIAQGGQSALFTLNFTPTVAGGLNDTLVVTTSTGGGTSLNAIVSGAGTTLLSAFNLTGATQGSLFAFPGVNSPSILLAAPGNINTEEPGSFVRLHDFGLINLEKQLMRVRGHYEDLGVATITIKARCRRIGQPDETITVNVGIGTVAADSWIREFVGELEVTGELQQITVSRAANSGPVSIIDYVPEFEPKGEVIGGT